MRLLRQASWRAIRLHHRQISGLLILASLLISCFLLSGGLGGTGGVEALQSSVDLASSVFVGSSADVGITTVKYGVLGIGAPGSPASIPYIT